MADPCTRSELRLWDVASHRPFGGPLQGHTGAITSLAYSPDGKTLASGSKDSTIMLWDIAGRRTLMGHASAVESLAFSPDGRRLASGSCVGRDCVRGEIRLWDVALGQQIGTSLIGHQKSVGSLAFSPDGKTLASSGLDGTLLFWDLTTRKRSLPLRLATGHGNDSIGIALAFSKDGTTLAASLADKTVFWDVASGRQVSELDAAGGIGAFFSSDGQTLVVASDLAIMLWDLRLERWKELACQIVTENLSQADWNQYVGASLPYNRTCPNLPADEDVLPPH